jgi:Asp-tRNA(Asn)/Glu-tRNA(Gln) amidotransferase A subunit family amidase
MVSTVCLVTRDASYGVVLGYVANIGDFATKDCVIVEILYELGAVPFVRTNVPQTLMVSNFMKYITLTKLP